MEQQKTITDHPKRRRRRRIDKAPISGWLKPSEQFQGNIGRISRYLFAELFRHDTEVDHALPETRYVAIAPWSPLSQDLFEDAAWTILPVQVHEDTEEETDGLGPSTIQLPTTALALESLAEAVQCSPAAKSNGKGRQGAEIRILDVEPLKLEAIYVTVDGNALNEHEEVQKQFGGGFDYTRTKGFIGKGKGKAKTAPHNKANGDGGREQVQEQEDRLALAVRGALASAVVVRQEDILSLPLPAHPITHVPLPPAKISLCEPISQGLLSDSTKIIVNRVFHADPVNGDLPSLAARKALHGRVLVDGYDTSNEQYFSNAENGVSGKTAESDVVEATSDSDSSGKDSDGYSDDSIRNMISMNAPRLPTHLSNILSSNTAATPRAGGPRLKGISPPDSVLSNCTAATARQGSKTKGRLLKARGLMSSIPDELLVPKPAVDEDAEARVFVDIKTLLKLGSFSGDWMRLEAASAPVNSRSTLWDVDALGTIDGQDDFKPVKVYGLPGLAQTATPRYPKGGAIGRTSGAAIVSGQGSSSLAAWLSPILLANLGNTSHVRLTPLVAYALQNVISRTAVKRARIDTSASPPVAKELTILRISSPLSTERALQTGIFTALKQYFESKRRILHQGDIIALQIDTGASRLLAPAISAPDVEHGTEEMLSLNLDSDSFAANNIDTAWFRVGQVTTSETDSTSQSTPADIWGGATCIEPTVTRMRQAGSEESKIPSASDNSWQYYLGVRPLLKDSNPHATAVGPYVAPMPQHQVAPARRRLHELLAAATSPRATHLGMNPMVILLHSTQRSIGKAALASGAASDLGLHVFDIDAYDVLAEGGSAGDVKTEALFKARAERALTCGPSCTVLLIRHVEALTADRMVTALKEVVTDIRVLIATTTEVETIPDGVRSLFTHELEISAPDEGEREGTLREIIDDRAIRVAHDVDLASIAVKSAALVAGDLVDIVERALVARQVRLEQIASKSTFVHGCSQQILVRDVLVSGGENARCIIKADFDVAVEAARKNFADAIGAPKIPNVSWDDVGGLENVKDAVMETIQLPLERPELFSKGMKKRSGILFYGPPGTGKTLLAKAIATEFSLNFFSVKGPELLNMYIGESEANVRRVFQRARDARPCVVFFDELDSVAPKRGNQGDSGGVMDRIVSQLLAELDGMSDGDEGAGGVFVLGATNRPDLLDQALLRPGRFDKMLYLGISDTHDKQQTILEALTRKFTMHPEMSLQRVAESLPFTYTGADLYALCSDAMLKAITRQASAVDAKIKALRGGPVTTAYFFDHLATKEDIAVMVTEEDFFAAQRELVGSVR